MDEDRLSPELGRLIDAVKNAVKGEPTNVADAEAVALLGACGGVGVGCGSGEAVSGAASAAAAALAALKQQGEDQVIAAAVAWYRPVGDAAWPSPGTLELLNSLSPDLPVALKRCGRWVAMRVSDVLCRQSKRSSQTLEEPVESRLEIVRLRRPDPAFLELLAGYESEAFGSLGLRACDLAVMAEAGAVFVAKLGDEVVGSCQVMRTLDEPGFLYLVGFYVRPRWRRQGFGATFLRLVLEEARELGADGVLLTVSPSNVAALALYRRAGFTEQELALDFYGAGEDRLLLRLRFGKDHLTGSV